MFELKSALKQQKKIKNLNKPTTVRLVKDWTNLIVAPFNAFWLKIRWNHGWQSDKLVWLVMLYLHYSKCIQSCFHLMSLYSFLKSVWSFTPEHSGVLLVNTGRQKHRSQTYADFLPFSGNSSKHTMLAPKLPKFAHRIYVIEINLSNLMSARSKSSWRNGKILEKQIEVLYWLCKWLKANAPL